MDSKAVYHHQLRITLLTTLLLTTLLTRYDYPHVAEYNSTNTILLIELAEERYRNDREAQLILVILINDRIAW